MGYKGRFVGLYGGNCHNNCGHICAGLRTYDENAITSHCSLEPVAYYESHATSLRGEDEER